MKECTHCHTPKKLDDFWRHKVTPDGRQSWCKLCVREQRKEARKANPTLFRGYAKKWIKANPLYHRQYKRKWDAERMKDPMHRLSNNLRGNMYHALKAKKGFRKWEDLVGYSLQDLINHLEPQLKAGMTWENYGQVWQVDHITPKSWFKYDSAEHPAFRECWKLNNLQPKLKVDNIRKGNRFVG
jgi:hypothetical protein